MVTSVTAATFEEHFASMVRAIDNCDVLAFDCEMSGIRHKDEPRATFLDPPQSRYAVAARAASSFQVRMRAERHTLARKLPHTPH